MTDFVEAVSKSSHKAVEHGKKTAMDHYRVATGATEREAESFYFQVRQLFCNDSKLVVNAGEGEVVGFLRGGEYVQQAGEKTTQAEKALGCHGSRPSYASLSGGIEGHRGRGGCSLVLSGVEDRVVLVSGSLHRVRNPAREDFVSDPELVMYSFRDAADCRAAAAVRSIPQSELVAGPVAVLRKLSCGGLKYDRCEALVFGRLTPRDVAMLVADGEASALVIRTALDDMGRIMPVAMVKGARGEEEDNDEATPRDEKPGYPDMLRPGGRVAMKPGATNPRVIGTVVEVSNGMVVVQWDNLERTVYDLTEAFSRLMPAPGAAPMVDGMVVYSLPGMDDGTVETLSAYGVDPVTLYSMVSHARPVSEKSSGWEEKLISVLSKMGVSAAVVEGYVASDADPRLAFKPGRWIEAALPEGNRIVVDASHDKVLITAGEAEDYVVPAPESGLLFE